MERIEGGVVTPTTDLIAQIKALLEKATPGPLVADLDVFDEDGEIEACVTNEGTTMLFTAGTDIKADYPDNVNWKRARESQELADAKLFAAAPTLLTACVEALEGMAAKVDEQERARAKLHEYAGIKSNQYCDALERADAAEAEVARLKDQIARMRPGTSGLLDELEAENARLKERVAAEEAKTDQALHRELYAAQARIAELEAALRRAHAAVDSLHEQSHPRDVERIADLQAANAALEAKVAELEKDAGLNGLCLNAMHAADEIQMERIATLEAALRLIAAIPAFPSKDIADKALGTHGPDWEPKAVKAYKAALSQARDGGEGET